MFLGGVKNNLDSRPAPSFPPPPNRLHIQFIFVAAGSNIVYMTYLFSKEFFSGGQGDNHSRVMEILVVMGSNFHIYAENYFIKYLSKKNHRTQTPPK